MLQGHAMRKRFLITLGAATTANGKVTTATSLRRIGGAAVALEGDAVHCPACGRDGVIRLDGPRLTERWNGKLVALEDDLCECGCSTPPKLVASQHIVWQDVAG
jgi:uncharacterized Zn-binding protein involved in type VI secretion